MEVLIFIALVIVIYLLSRIQSKQKETQDRFLQSFHSLKRELQELKEAGIQTSDKKETPLSPTDEKVVQWRPYNEPVIIEKILIPPATEAEQEPIIKGDIPALEMITDADLSANAGSIDASPIFKRAEPAESFWQKWMRNNPDLEKFVGENLINKIGIAVLVLGIAFFVKYAIDQNWIKETGRVCIGIGCGVILVGIAHYLRNSYKSFSSVLAGGGIAVFYFTIAFAFHEYGMFSQTQAFVIMLVITAFAVVLALLYNKIELAVIALVGGFLVPFLVSNGSGNYIVLFTYLIVLNIGMLCIAYFKKWQLLQVLAFFFTLIIFGGWIVQQYVFETQPVSNQNALLFASAFYLIFLTATMIHNLRTQKPFKAFDFSLMLVITFSFYAEGMTVLHEWNHGEYQGIFTIVLGIINCCLAWYLYKTQKGDRNLLYLLIGLTLTFISLAAPAQLHGHTITLFWSAECVLLYWLHQKSSIQIFKYSSAIVLLLMLLSLLLDWSKANANSDTVLPVIFNNWQGIITNIVAVLSLVLYGFLLWRNASGNAYLFGFSNTIAAVLMAVLSCVLLYITFIFGVNLFFIKEQSFAVPNVYHQLVTDIFIAAILLLISRARSFDKPFLSVTLILASFVFYVSSTSLANSLMTGVVEHTYAGVHAWAHWLVDVCLLYLFYQLIVLFRKNIASLSNRFAWVISLVLLVFFSIECRHLYVALLADKASLPIVAGQYSKAGITIVWALLSFVMMWLGMQHKYKTLRIISLSIFSMALLKLFLFDITNVSEGGKIAAFIMLGVLLLVISFMYQRLKKIIIDNEEKYS